MNEMIQQIDNTYIECLPANPIQVRSERDALDLVALCGENRISRLLLYAGHLSEDFFHLSTGVAGSILLKFTTYRIKLALVAPPERIRQGKFAELVNETNRGGDFGVFASRAEAVAWLTRNSVPQEENR